jgi:hypothetical protein
MTATVKIVHPEHKAMYRELVRAPVRGDVIEYDMTGEMFQVVKVVFSTTTQLVTVYVEKTE